jgi:hypothetical protein
VPVRVFFCRLSSERNYDSTSDAVSPFLDDAQSGHSKEVNVLYGVDVRWPARSREGDYAHLLDSMSINTSSPPSRALTQPGPRTLYASRLWDLQTFLNDASALFGDPQDALALGLIGAMELVIGRTGTDSL